MLDYNIAEVDLGGVSVHSSVASTGWRPSTHTHTCTCTHIHCWVWVCVVYIKIRLESVAAKYCLSVCVLNHVINLISSARTW